MTNTMLRRTQLATPASEPRFIASAARGDADETILDLEDSVVPEEKAGARTSLAAGVRDHDWSDKILSYRINDIGTKWWYDDIIEVISSVGDQIDDIVVPKVTNSSDVHTVENLLEQVEVNAGLDVGDIGLQPQIENGEGTHNVHEIAHSSDRLSSIIFGPGDYAAAMGAPGLDIGQFPEYPGHYWHHVLSECNAAAKSASLPCIDGPYSDLDDQEGFRASAQNANLLGCDGKWVIHPSQIEVANEVFAPDPEVAKRAEQIVEAYTESMEEGRGAVTVDGQMVDEATHKMVQEVVEQARAAGVL